jgi:hypothetical protein
MAMAVNDAQEQPRRLLVLNAAEVVPSQIFVSC